MQRQQCWPTESTRQGQDRQTRGKKKDGTEGLNGKGPFRQERIGRILAFGSTFYYVFLAFRRKGGGRKAKPTWNVPLKWSFLILLRVVWPFLPPLLQFQRTVLPLFHIQPGQRFLGVETWVTHYLQNIWPFAQNPAGNKQGRFSDPRPLFPWQLQGYRELDMLDLSSLSQTFKAKLELMEFLPRNTARWAADLPGRRGGCHPAHMKLSGANMFHKGGHTRIGPVLERAASLCTRESHFTSSACWHIPEFTLTLSSHPEQRTLTPLAHQVICPL